MPRNQEALLAIRRGLRLAPGEARTFGMLVLVVQNAPLNLERDKPDQAEAKRKVGKS